MRMIQYKDRLFPWSEPLLALSGAMEVEIEDKDIAPPSVGQKDSVQLYTKPTQKPGTGWIKNRFGKWKRRIKT